MWIEDLRELSRRSTGGDQANGQPSLARRLSGAALQLERLATEGVHEVWMRRAGRH
jgi:hypothetical protein